MLRFFIADCPSPDCNGILLYPSGFKNLTGIKDKVESRKQLLPSTTLRMTVLFFMIFITLLCTKICKFTNTTKDYLWKPILKATL